MMRIIILISIVFFSGCASNQSCANIEAKYQTKYCSPNIHHNYDLRNLKKD